MKLPNAILKVTLLIVFPLFAWAGVLPVLNPSFEILPTGGLNSTSCTQPCSYSVGEAIPDWTSSDPTNAGDGEFQPGSPTNTAYFNVLASGPTSAYTTGATLSQVVGTVTPDFTYTLTVAIGDNKYDSFDGSAALLINGVTYLATGTAPTSGNWSTYTATYVGQVADSGDPITIELLASGKQGNFDNVSLTDVVPEPAFGGLVAASLIGLFGWQRRKRAR